MNNRLAKKILQCASRLHTNAEKVKLARKQVVDNREYFKQKGIYIIETPSCSLRTL